MSKFNIYKIKEAKVDELVAHLVSDRKYQLVSHQSLDGYDVNSYFSDPEDATMQWLTQYGTAFFGEHSRKHNIIYSGAIIARRDNHAYVLPFGKTHFYIQEYIVFNFGLEMAEKIADQNDAKMKSLKRFGGKTSKSLISFTSGSSLDFSSGDSAEYLKLKPSNKKDWGKSFIHFGTSIQFGGLNLDAKELGKLLNQIDSAWNREKIFSIPLMRPIKDEAQELALYRELGNKITNHDENVGFVDYEIYGTEFVFSQQTHVRLKYKNITSENLADLDTTDISNFAESNGIDLQRELPEIRVQIIVDGQSKYTTQLLNLVEYVTGGNVFLYRGKWFYFNTSFIEELHKSLDNILPSRFTDSFSEDEFMAWEKSLPEDAVKYRERFVIVKMSDLHGFEVYDRKLEYIPYGGKKYSIEVGDVYDKENKRMYVVKIGDPRDFAYAFDQAMIVLHNMIGKKFNIATGGSIEINIMTILLIFRTEKTLEKVTGTKSLLFELKLDELRKLATEKGVTLEVQYSTII